MIKKIVSTIILSVFIFSYAPTIIYAGVLDSIGGFTTCSASGIVAGQLTPHLSNYINQGVNKLAGLLPKFKLGGLAGGGSVPVNDADLNAKYQSKEYVQDIIGRCAAREIFNQMSSGIINIARTSGRDGGPAYVRNWRNFQLEAQHRGEDIFRGMLSSTNLCNYFGDDLKTLFGANQKISLTKIETRSNNFDSFALQTGCTMPKNFNFQNYKQDFSGNGGWEAWSRLMEPQNNYYGTLFQSLDEADRQRSIEESADLNQILANDGFLGRSGNNANDSCEQRSATGRCIIYKDIKTPGGVIKASVDASIMQELAWVTNTDELNELIATGIDVLLNRLTDLSNPDEGVYQVPGEVDYDPNTLPAPEPGPAPAPETFGTITVNFEITNDSGGSATVDDFQLFISGELTAIGLSRVLPIGDYVVSSGGPSNYALIGIRGACDGDGSVTIVESQTLVCTVTYDDL